MTPDRRLGAAAVPDRPDRPDRARSVRLREARRALPSGEPETTMSKSHPQQWAIITDDHRPDPASVAALAALPTTQIADCGGPVAVVGAGIGRLGGGGGVWGPAL